MRKVITKLRSQKGDTLVETLVAILVSSLSILMVTTAIISSANMVRESEKKLTNYYDGGEAVISRDGTSYKGSANLRYNGSTLKNYDVNVYENDENPEVMSYGVVTTS